MKKGASFEKKDPKDFTSPPIQSFLSVLHQSKALHNFAKGGSFR